MAWDQNLLKKYSSTSHFRLLSQLRGELLAHPINRMTVNRRDVIQEKPTSRTDMRASRRDDIQEKPASRTDMRAPRSDDFQEKPASRSDMRVSRRDDVEEKPAGRSDMRASRSPSNQQSTQLEQEQALNTLADSSSSFRERLNAVEMR